MTRAALLYLSLISAFAADKHTLLAIFSHPDDETAVATLLAKYAAEGHRVQLVYTTSGQNAETMPTLGKVREAEARCAAKAIGVPEPVFLGLINGTLVDRPNTVALAPKVRAAIEDVKPDVILTFGADGYSGHPDNRVTGNVVTQVFAQRGLLKHKPKKLYYMVRPESRLKSSAPPNFIGPNREFYLTSDEFVTTVVDGRKFNQQSMGAIRCNKSQFNDERMKDLYEMHAKDLDGIVDLRLGLTVLPFPSKKEASIFDGL